MSTSDQTGVCRPFVGSFRHSLDPKRRITIPSEWRELILPSDRLYVLPGIGESCLYVFPELEMAEILTRVRSHSISDPMERRFARVLASRSDLVKWDAQGRIRIKDDLLSRAGIGDQVVLAGAFRRFEIWAPEEWDASQSVDDKEFGDAARHAGI